MTRPSQARRPCVGQLLGPDGAMISRARPARPPAAFCGCHLRGELGQPVAEGAVEQAVAGARRGCGPGRDRRRSAGRGRRPGRRATLTPFRRRRRRRSRPGRAGVPLVQQHHRHRDGVVDHLVDHRLLRAVLARDQPRPDEKVRLEVAFDGQAGDPVQYPRSHDRGSFLALIGAVRVRRPGLPAPARHCGPGRAHAAGRPAPSRASSPARGCAASWSSARAGACSAAPAGRHTPAPHRGRRPVCTSRTRRDCQVYRSRTPAGRLLNSSASGSAGERAGAARRAGPHRGRSAGCRCRRRPG